MKKTIFTIALIILISPSILAFQNCQKLNQDIEIEIYAGVYDNTNGKFGLGWVVSVINNLNESINGTINASWNTFSSKTVRFENNSFNLSANHPKINYQFIDYIHLPYPIIKLTVIVQIRDQVYSRYGIEIGPIVIFKDYI
jgi:hypothetical protein